MPYVHLANGTIKQLTDDEMQETFGDESPRVFRDGNIEYTIVGIYPDGVEMPKEEKEEKPKTGGLTDYTKDKK